MSHRLPLVPLLSLIILCSGGTVFAASELSERLIQAEADLKKARESLHVAHQELGEKTEEIRQLKKALEKSPSARRKKGAAEEVSKLKRELQAANAKIQNFEKKIEVAAVAAKRRDAAAKVEAKAVAAKEIAAKKAEAEKMKLQKAEASRASAAPEIFKVNYELNSAANLEGRERALKWIQARVKKDSGAKFEIRGRANDREFREANRAIAENRANFLASFLRVSGVPSDVIAKVSGDASSTEGTAGRIVEVIKVP